MNMLGAWGSTVKPTTVQSYTICVENFCFA